MTKSTIKFPRATSACTQSNLKIKLDKQNGVENYIKVQMKIGKMPNRNFLG